MMGAGCRSFYENSDIRLQLPMERRFYSLFFKKLRAQNLAINIDMNAVNFQHSGQRIF